MADEKQLEQLSAKVNAIEESLTPEKIGATLAETIANAVKVAVKPLTDNLAEIQANQKAEEDAKRAAAVNALTKSGQWTEADLEGMTLAALNKLVEKTKPGKAAALNGAFTNGADKDEWEGYDLNANIGDKQKEVH